MKPSSDSTPRRREAAAPSPAALARKAARRRQILGAAMQLFIERGYTLTSLDDVAHRAGIAKGTVYLHFIDKAVLFEETICDWVEQRVARLRSQPMVVPGRTREAFAASYAHWARAQDLDGLTRVMLLVLSRSFESPQLVGKLSEQLASCMASVPWPGRGGEPQPSAREAPDDFPVRMQLMSLCLVGTACMPRLENGTSAAAVTEAMIELIWRRAGAAR